MMRMDKRATWTAMIATVGLTGCKELEPIEQQGAGNAVPAQVQLIFSEKCSISGCHDGTTPPLLTAGADVVGATASTGIPLVDFGSPSNSYLAIKIADIPGAPPRTGSLMPIGLELTVDEIAIVLGWIAGAPFPTGGTTGGTTGGGNATMGATTGGAETGTTTGGTGGTGGGAAFIPAEVANVFTSNCDGASCHISGPFPPDLSDPSAIIGVDASVGIPLVDPGNVANSYVAIKMTDVPGATVDRSGQVMPPESEPPVPDAELQLVLDWIENGPFTADAGGSAGTTGM